MHATSSNVSSRTALLSRIWRGKRLKNTDTNYRSLPGCGTEQVGQPVSQGGFAGRGRTGYYAQHRDPYVNYDGP